MILFSIYVDFLARILKDFNQTLYLFQVTSICSFFNVGFVIQVEDSKNEKIRMNIIPQMNIHEIYKC